MSLEAAQIAKMRLVAEKLDLKPGGSVDWGCFCFSEGVVFSFLGGYCRRTVLSSLCVLESKVS